MAHYFLGRKEKELIEFTYDKGKAKVTCRIFDWWKALDITEAACGDPVEYTVEKSLGISETDKHALEATLEASLGLEKVIQLKSKISEKVETEIHWEVTKKETKKFVLNPPKCGRKTNTVFQLVREYSFVNERRKFFGRIESWATVITEHLHYYSVRPNVEPWIPDCGCKEVTPEFDGTFDCDFGTVGLQIQASVTTNGLTLNFDGIDGELDLTDDAEINNLEISVPTGALPEVVRWLGQIEGEKIEGLLIRFDGFASENVLALDESVAVAPTAKQLGALELSVSPKILVESDLTNKA